jgi:hypothetical protein
MSSGCYYYEMERGDKFNKKEPSIVPFLLVGAGFLAVVVGVSRALAPSGKGLNQQEMQADSERRNMAMGVAGIGTVIALIGIG